MKPVISRDNKAVLELIQ